MMRWALLSVVALAIDLTSTAHARPLRLLIDPGHGGKDRGALGPLQNEAEINLEIALLLARALRARGGFEVTLSREDDRFVPLNERTELAERAKADLILSLHANSSPDSGNKGLEVYIGSTLLPDEASLLLARREQSLEADSINQRYFPRFRDDYLKSLNPTVRTIIEDLKNTARLERSALAATKIADSWMGERKTTRNTIQQASLFLVAAATVPSVLVEMGFLTHPNEARLLSSEDYRQKIIDGLTEALLRYKETLDKT